MKEELEKMLEELKEDLEKKLEDYKLDAVRYNNAEGIVTTHSILKNMDKGKSLVEASSDIIRSYDDALAKCLEAGAKADDEFMYVFTTQYLTTILSLVANLFTVKDFAKDKDNLAFLKSKVRECLIYIDIL